MSEEVLWWPFKPPGSGKDKKVTLPEPLPPPEPIPALKPTPRLVEPQVGVKEREAQKHRRKSLATRLALQEPEIETQKLGA